jgi:hypothetical protein
VLDLYIFVRRLGWKRLLIWGAVVSVELNLLGAIIEEPPDDAWCYAVLLLLALYLTNWIFYRANRFRLTRAWEVYLRVTGLDEWLDEELRKKE